MVLSFSEGLTFDEANGIECHGIFAQVGEDGIYEVRTYGRHDRFSCRFNFFRAGFLLFGIVYLNSTGFNVFILFYFHLQGLISVCWGLKWPSKWRKPSINRWRSWSDRCGDRRLTLVARANGCRNGDWNWVCWFQNWKKGTNVTMYIYIYTVIENMYTYINILDLFCGINHPNVVSVLLVRDACDFLGCLVFRGYPYVSKPSPDHRGLLSFRTIRWKGKTLRTSLSRETPRWGDLEAWMIVMVADDMESWAIWNLSGKTRRHRHMFVFAWQGIHLMSEFILLFPSRRRFEKPVQIDCHPLFALICSSKMVGFTFCTQDSSCIGSKDSWAWHDNFCSTRFTIC